MHAIQDVTDNQHILIKALGIHHRYHYDIISIVIINVWCVVPILVTVQPQCTGQRAVQFSQAHYSSLGWCYLQILSKSAEPFFLQVR